MSTSAEASITKVHWANSLIARVVALCVVLVLCLLGSVYVLTVHFLKEVQAEYENRAFEMASSAQVYLERHTEESSSVESTIRDLEEKYKGAKFNIDPTDPAAMSEELEHTDTKLTEAGEILITSTHIIKQKGKLPLAFTVEFKVDPQAAVWSAFTNRYIALLTASFVIALGLMVYFILKTLRPLRDLAKSCAQIGAGDLAPVEIKRNYGEVLALEQTFNRMVEALRDKEQIEANLRQAQRLSALGSLAAGIAHDVRNPLNAIKLLSSHALDNLNGGDNENGTSQRLRTIRKEVDRLEEIVSGFLALAKERELQPEPVKVDPLVDDCVHLVKAEAETRGVSLTGELGAGSLQIDIDPKQVKRAVLNVIINAVEACPGGGRVRVFTRTAEDSYQIEVRDNGPGLTKDVAERAFDPYFTTKPSGTGIGLSITRGIFEEHGGSVSLTSALGEGCHVLMTLPLRKTATV